MERNLVRLNLFARYIECAGERHLKCEETRLMTDIELDLIAEKHRLDILRHATHCALAKVVAKELIESGVHTLSM